MVTILMMSAKMATPDLLRIKTFWKKYYDVIIGFHGNKILSRDSNYNVNVVMWQKFGNSSISVRELEKFSHPQFYKDLTRISIFSEVWFRPHPDLNRFKVLSVCAIKLWWQLCIMLILFVFFPKYYQNVLLFSYPNSFFHYICPPSFHTTILWSIEKLVD